MHTLTAIFLLALTAHLAVRLWLAQRQIRFVETHRTAVPAGFGAVVSPAEHARAADYVAAGERLDMVEAVYDTLVALALTLGGGIAFPRSQLLDAGIVFLAPLAEHASQLHDRNDRDDERYQRQNV